MATSEGIQALLELNDDQFSAVVEDRARAYREARERIQAAAAHFPPEGEPFAASGALEAAQQRIEEASTAFELRYATLKAQIAELRELL